MRGGYTQRSQGFIGEDSTILPSLFRFGKYQHGLWKAVRASLITLITCCLTLVRVSGQTNTWVGPSGSFWSTSSNWSLGVVPTAAHDVVIPTAKTIFMNTNGQCNKIELDGGIGDILILFSGTYSLTVSDSVIIHAGASILSQGDDREIAVLNGSLICTTIVMDSSTDNTIESKISCSSGTIDVSGNIVMQSSAPRNVVKFTSSGILNIGGNLNGGGIESSTSTINYNGTSAQSISDYAYYNLTLSGGGTKTFSENCSISGNLLVDAGAIVHLGDYDLTIDANADLTAVIDGTLNIDGNGRLIELQGGMKTLEVGATGILNITDAGGSTLPVFDHYDFEITSTVNYGSTDAQTIENSATYGVLEISGGNTKSLEGSGDTTFVQGELRIDPGGTLAAAANIIQLEGNWTNEGGFDAGTGTIVFSGAALQTVGGSEPTTFTKVTINNSDAGVLLANTMTIDSALTLIDGILTTDANTLIINNTASGTMTGGDSGAYVHGNLEQSVASGVHGYMFPLGSSGAYAPVTLNFTAGTTAGMITGTTYSGDHPNIDNSTLYPASSVNRYWIFAVQSGLGTANYDATFNWDITDEDSSFDYQSSQVGKYTLTTWYYPTVDTRAATSVTITGLSGFSDFQVSSCAEPVILTQPADITVCDAGSAQIEVTTNEPGDIAYQWYKSGVGMLSNGGNISGVMTKTLHINPASSGDAGNYYVNISRVCGADTTSSEATLNVLNPVDYGTISSADETLCSAGNPSVIVFSIAPSGGDSTFNYQWYYKDGLVSCPSGSNTSGWTMISGATTDAYDPPTGLTVNRTYAVQVGPTGSPDCGNIQWTSGCRQVHINDISAGIINQDQTICSGGDPAAFTVGTPASGSGSLSYQWQSSTTDCSSGFSDITTATDATYNPPAGITETTYYRRNATSTLNGVACSAMSNCVTVTVNDITGGSIGINQTICSGGDPAVFTVDTVATASGLLTYQWQSSTTDCGNGYSDISGATNATYDPPAVVTETTYYRRTATSTLNSVACTANSNCVTVTINDVSGGSIATDQTICSGGDPVALSIDAAASGSGSLTYQWQSSTSSCASGFTDILGATNDVYDPPSGLIVTTYYRRVVTSTLNNIECVALSNCVAVTINDVSGGSIATDQTICSGGDPSGFTIDTAASGSGGMTYQWQSSTSSCASGFTDIVGATNDVYDPPSGLTETTYYRRVVTSALNSIECAALSNCVTVTINDVSAGSIAADQTICSGGDPVAFSIDTAATASGVLTYQWQSSTTNCGNGFADIPEATNNVYDPESGLTETTYYRREAISTLNSTGCPALSNCVVVTVNDISAGSIGFDQTICSGGDPAVLSTDVSAAGAGTLMYQWQSSVVGCGSGFSDIAGATTEMYDPPSGQTETTYYRRQVISTLNSVACSALSNCIVVTINDVSGGSINSDQTICSGGDPDAILVSQSASGSGALTYQWQSSTTDCNTGFSDIPGATNDTYDPPSGITSTVYYRRAVTSTLNGIACTTTSNCISIIVNDVSAGTVTGDQTICSGGDPATFTVGVAAIGSGALTYQWQSSTSNCTNNFADIAGATNDTYDPPSGVAATTFYRRSVTSTLNAIPCTAIGNCIVVTIDTIDPGSVSGDQIICSGGDPISFAVDMPATGSGTLTYQWQSGTTNCATGFSDIPGATNEIYDPPSGLTQTTYYKRTATSILNGVSCFGISNCLTVTVNTVDAGTISTDQTICSGDDPMVFTVSSPATGAGALTYQWQRSDTSCSMGFIDIPGATQVVYTPLPGATLTQYYRRKVTSTLDTVVCADLSNCITVAVNDVDPGSISEDQIICPGGDPDAITETGAASGSGEVTYQWQSSTTDCTNGFADIPGATDDVYDPPAGLTTSTFYRRIAISTLDGIPCGGQSNCITVTVNSVEGGSLLADQTICSSGDPGAFIIDEPASGLGTLTYQWQSSTTDCVGGFTDIPGATDDVYDPPSGLLVTTFYRRSVTSSLSGVQCTATSNCITVSVNDIDPGSVSSDQTICSGGNTSAFTISDPAIGSGTLTYQWQSSTTDCLSGFADIPGATSSTFNPPTNLTVTTHYRRQATSTLNGVACSAYSNCVTVFVNTVYEGTIESDQTICTGGDPAPLVSGVAPTGEGELSFQWRSSTNNCNGGFADIPGATDETYDPPPGSVTEETHFRRRVYSTLNGVSCMAQNSCITIYVNDVTSGGISGDQTICLEGDPDPFSSISSGSGTGALTYQWQSGTTDCTSGFTDIPGATATTYDPPGGVIATTYYRRLAISTLNGVPCSAPSNCVTVAIDVINGGIITSDQTICSGSDPEPLITDTAATGLGTLTYQWQNSSNDCANGFSNIPGGTDQTYDPPALSATTYYRRVVTSTLGGLVCSGLSNCITITVNDVSGGSISADQTICSGGDPAVLTTDVSATGSGTLTYQWQSSVTGCGSGFSDIGGATTETYDPPSGETMTTYYRRQVTSTLNSISCSALSNCVTITVNDVSGGSITADQTICSGGDPAVLTTDVSATGSGTLTYQWQSSVTGCGSGFTDIGGATTETYDPPSGETMTTYYRRQVTSTLNSISCSALSNCVTITVNDVSGGSITADQTICSGGDPIVLTTDVSATGTGTLTYQWQSSVTGCGSGFTDIGGATTETYDPPSGETMTTYYRRQATSTLNSILCSALSNCVTITVNDVSGGSITSDQTICSGGDPVSLTTDVSATGSGALTYQWQNSVTSCGSGFSDIGGATTETYDPPSGQTVTTYFRRQVTSTLNSIPCSALSNCVTITVNDVSGGSITADQTICSGGDPIVLTTDVSATGTGILTYQWQNSVTSCGSGFTDIGGATTETYDPPSGETMTTYYRRQVTSTLNSISCSALSNCVTITVNDVSGGSITADQTICSGGDPIVLTTDVSATGTGILTYQWQNSVTSCGSGFTDIGGATTETYDPPSGETMTTYYRRQVTSTLNSISCSALSNCVTITVNDVSGGSITADQTICSGGDPIVLTTDVSATGTGILTYQWQSSVTGCGSGFTDIGGATTETYDPPSGQTVTTYYRRQATSTLNSILCSALSNCVTITVNDVSGGSITSDQTICSGGDPVFLTTDVSATGSGALTYQWQSSVTGCGSGFSDIGGATTETYDPPSGETMTTYYRRQVTSTLNSTPCSALSNCVTITVNDVSGGSITADQTICSGGDPIVLTTDVSATGTGILTYQWQNSVTSCGSGFTDIGGATTETYDPPSGETMTTYYRRQVTSTLNSISCSALSNCVTITINDVSGGSITADQTICSGGDPIVLTTDVSATGTGILTYQWQNSVTSCGSGFTDIGGATTETYDPPSGETMTTYYRRQATSTLNSILCSALSNCVTITVNDVSGGSITSDQTICSGGDPVSLTTDVSATGSGALTYQWQNSVTSCGSGFSDIGGATTETYDPPSGQTVTTYFRRQVTSTLNNISCNAFSNCVTITVNDVSGGSITSDQTICSGGDPVSLTTDVSATGSGTLTYQWQSSVTGCGSGFSDIGGATDETYDPPSGQTVTTYFRRQVTSTLNNISCSALSNCVTITVNDVSGGSITADQTICSGGDPIVLTTDVSATGTGILTYQWQSSVAGCGSGFSDIGGATNETYDPPAGQTMTTYYRRQVTSTLNNISCNAFSNCVTITVNDVSGGSITSDQTICSGGDPVSLSTDVSATGSGSLTYQWQSSVTSCGSGFSDIGGATNETYDPPAGQTMTTYYRRQVTSTLNSIPCNAFSNCVTITVNDVSGGSITSDQTICSGGDPVSLTTDVSATGSGSLTYQWQSSVTGCGSGFTDIGGATDETYDPPSGQTVTTYYRRRVTSTLNNISCNAFSNCVTITVNDVSGGSITADQTVCSGADPVFLTTDVSATGSGTLTYQWQSSVTGCGSGFTDIGGATDETYDPPSGQTVTTYYRRRVTSTLNNISCNAFSNCVTITVNDVSGGSITSDQTICSEGDPVALTTDISATGSGALTYQWQSSVADCGTGFSDIVGATTETYDPPSGQTMTTYYRRQVISTLNGISCTALSNCVTITTNDVSAGSIANDQTVCYGGDAMILTTDISATGSGALSYQWQSGVAGCGGGFSDIGGATNETYDPPSGLAANTFYRRSVISTLNGVQCAALSNCVTVIVLEDVTFGSVSSDDESICAHGDPQNIQFSTLPTGGTGIFSFQWYYQDGLVSCPVGTDVTGWNAMSSATNTSYDPPPGLTASRTYAVQVNAAGSPDCGDPVWSDGCRQVTVYDTIIISGVVSGVDTIYLCDGGNPVPFNAGSPAGGDGNYTYLWQQSEGCSGIWTPADAEDGLTNTLNLDPPVLTLPLTEICYRLKITDGCGSVGYSDVKTYHVVPDPVSPLIHPVPDDGSVVCLGTSVYATFDPGSGGAGMITDTYEYTINNGQTWIPYTEGAPILVTDQMIGSNTIRIRTQRTATGSGCDTAPYHSVEWSVDTIAPLISSCPVNRNISGCDLNAVTGPVYSNVITASDYTEFSGAMNLGIASDACGITTVVYRDSATGSCPIVLTRTWTIGDSAGNSTSCNQAIQIIAPEIVTTCPGDIDLGSCAMQQDIDNAFATWISALESSVNGGCAPQVSYLLGGTPVNPGNLTPPDHCNGDTLTIEISYTDVCASESAFCTSTFKVSEAPAVITNCPSDVSIPACMDQQEVDDAFNTWISALHNSVSGGCIPQVLYKTGGEIIDPDTLSIPDHCSGSTLTINVSYTDLCDSISGFCTSTFAIAASPDVVTDCPDDISLPSCIDQQEVDDTFAVWRSALGGSVSGGCNPVVTYTIDGVSINPGDLLSPDRCMGDTIAVTIQYDDVCETGSCLSTFAVSGVPQVNVNCPGDIVLSACASQQEIDSIFAIWINNLENSITGGCMPDITFIANGNTVVDLNTVAAPPVCIGGSVTVFVVFTDLCTSGGCLSTFDVTPNNPPSLSNPPGDQEYFSLPSECDRIISITKPESNDDCDSVLTLTLEADDPNIIIADLGDEWQGDFPPGVTTLTITGTDHCGNTATDVFTITVMDEIAPELMNCPGDLTVGNDPGQCGATVSWIAPTASDNCPGVLLTTSHTPGAFFDVGITTVTYTATDASGLTSACSFLVTVQDTSAPVIDCGTLMTINLSSNGPPDCNNDTDINVPNAQDNCDGTILASGTRSDGLSLNDPWPEDTTTVTWTFSDTAGNITECAQNVVVALCVWPSQYVYVDSSKTNGNQTGLDWANALLRIQDAISLATQYPQIEEIWVARGTYYPTQGTDRNSSFQLINNIKLLGGFAGIAEDSSDRDILANPTYLSGDIGTLNNSSDNSYHVVRAGTSIQNAVVDGFTIKGGNANVTGSLRDIGGGVLIQGQMLFANCIITDNHASTLGSAIYATGSMAEITLKDCFVHNNVSGNRRYLVIMNGAELHIQGINQIDQ